MNPPHCMRCRLESSAAACCTGSLLLRAQTVQFRCKRVYISSAAAVNADNRLSRIHSTCLNPFYLFEKTLPVLMATFQCCYKD
uniref:Uncharacterized protein n=1 Tax=Hyaloperonospora arabidopsidis (strain Emoy2) TaxID=559515 RepID=M4BU99_HYAAE